MDRFYAEVMQSLKSWSPPPRMQQSEPARDAQPQRRATADPEVAADTPAEPVDVPAAQLPEGPRAVDVPGQMPERPHLVEEFRVG